MSIVLRIPPINPFRFAEADLVLPDKWGYPAFGRALQLDSLKPHQVKEQYYQKVGTGDPVCLQLHRGRTGDNTLANNPSELRIFEVGSNTQLKVLAPTVVTTLAGVTDAITGEQLYTEQYLFTPASLSELNGKKYIYFELWHYYDGVTFSNDTKYRGNPIYLADRHDKTSLVEYNQLVNGHDILFEQLTPRFAYRIDSKGMTYDAGGDYTVFEDQDRSTVTLDAEAFNVFKWDIGGSSGLPEYMIDVINRSLQCCKDGYFRVDGREYVWQDGKLNTTAGEGKQVQWREVMLRQKDEQDGYTFAVRKINLFQVPATGYPFAITPCGLFDHFTQLAVLTNGQGSKVFDDLTGLTTWIGAFNTVITDAGYTATVVKDGALVYLLNGENERFNLLLPVQVLNKLITLTSTVDAFNPIVQYRVTYPNTFIHFHVACYGATSGSEELKANSFGNPVCTSTHTFSTFGSKTTRIFHRDEEIEFESITTVGDTLAKLSNITGAMSVNLSSLYLSGHAIPTMNLAILAPAKDNIISLTLNDCGITAFTANWASALASGGYKPFYQMRFNSIRGNALTSTEVDAFFNEFFTYVGWFDGMLFAGIDISANTPAAPPTGASLAARNGLLHWNLTTD